jgi:anion transporter
MSRTRITGILVVSVIAIIIGTTKPFVGLSPQGHYLLALTLVSLSLWIFRTGSVPFLAGGTILLAGALVFKVPLGTVMSGFTNAAVWTLIPALFFGYALAKTGLGNRIAYYVLKSFKPSYLSICVSWFIIGLILSALTPSIVVRFAIVMPIAMSIVGACELPDRSRGCALISFVAWGTALLPGTCWQTGSLWGIFMMGFYPPEMKVLATPGAWFSYMAVPWFLVSILFLVLVYIFFKPKEPLQLSRETFKKQYESLGKITKQEIACAIILIGALILFSTEKWTGIRTVEAALIAFAALILSGIIKTPDISSGVNWDIICFFGVIMSLTVMFGKTGVSDWVRPMIEPGVLSIAGSPVIFLFVITGVLMLIRFIDIAWGFATIALLAPLFIPLYQQYGLHPVLISVCVVAAGNSFFLSYQQPFIVMGEAFSKSRAWMPSHVALAGLIYLISITIGMLISSFYWKAAGLMP